MVERETYQVITAELIDALPRGCLVVQVTRAFICDLDALFRRVLNDELALATDVFSTGPARRSGEPVSLDSPLLGRHNVVHTPHIAGRTRRCQSRLGRRYHRPIQGTTMPWRSRRRERECGSAALASWTGWTLDPGMVISARPALDYDASTWSFDTPTCSRGGTHSGTGGARCATAGSAGVGTPSRFQVGGISPAVKRSA